MRLWPTKAHWSRLHAFCPRAESLIPKHISVSSGAFSGLAAEIFKAGIPYALANPQAIDDFNKMMLPFVSLLSILSEGEVT